MSRRCVRRAEHRRSRRGAGSLLSRVSDRLATDEEQTHQDKRHAEELRAAADDLLSRLDQ
jgi:hypothetical protein